MFSGILIAGCLALGQSLEDYKSVLARVEKGETVIVCVGDTKIVRGAIRIDNFPQERPGQIFKCWRNAEGVPKYETYYPRQYCDGRSCYWQ